MKNLIFGLSALAMGANGISQTTTANSKDPIKGPLITNIYTADPSAHVFNGKIYIYPSHDVENNNNSQNNEASHFAMRDYHVLSMDAVGSEVIDNGAAIDVDDVPWAEKQMWAPDAAEKDGKYYLYFPARAYDGLFKMGVAVGDSPTGPFKAEPNPIEGSYSIDPAVFKDDDGSHYMFFGGIWGGQLQNYRNNQYDGSITGNEPGNNERAMMPKIAKLESGMTEFTEIPKDIEILDENGNLMLAGNKEKRFFEAAWLHKYDGKYYFSYSTGDTHRIVYATGDSPYGPFTYQGRILDPVLGWTNHHSITEINNKWYLFYHDSSLSKGVTHLRSVKMVELTHDANGKIKTIDPDNLPEPTPPTTPTTPGMGCMIINKDGLLVIEAESMTKTSKWEERSDHLASGKKYLTYTGNNSFGQVTDAVLEVAFKITEAGSYTVKWLMRQPEDVPGDMSNDAWINFTNATQLARGEVIKGFNKFVGRSTGTFGLAGQLDLQGDQQWFNVRFDKPGT